MDNDNLRDDVIKWKHFQRYWPFVRGIHRSPVNSPHKGQWRGALMFSLIGAGINGEQTTVRLVICDAIAPIMTSLKWPVDLMKRIVAVIAMTIYTTKLVLSRFNADWNILKAKYIHIQWRVSWTVKSEANLGKWYVNWGNSFSFSHDEYFFKPCSTKLYAFCCRMCLI